MLSFFKRSRDILKRPGVYFKRIKNENDYKTPFLYFILTSLILFIGLVPYTIILTASMFDSVLAIVGMVLAMSIGFLVSIMISPFINAAIIHLGVLLLKGKRGFINTFKVICYINILNAIYGLLIFIFNSFLLLSVQGRISQGILIFLMVFYIIIVAIANIHLLIVIILGLSKLQSFSKWRAFFSIIIIPLMIMGLLVLTGFLGGLLFSLLLP